MRNTTESIKQSYKSVTTFSQLNEINSKALSELRMVQKNAIKLIERSYNKKKCFTSEESEYVFNLYYNFVILKYSFKPLQQIKEKRKSFQHVGMRMLNQLST